MFHKFSVLMLPLAALLPACGGDDSNGGNLTLSVADAPVDDASRIVIAFTGVELKPQDGDLVNFVFSRPLDLLALTGGNSATLLAGVQVPPGAYSSVRLK